jgi:hypothetical protein
MRSDNGSMRAIAAELRGRTGNLTPDDVHVLKTRYA